MFIANVSAVYRHGISKTQGTQLVVVLKEKLTRTNGEI
jgi:hypothetical protein